MNQLTQERLNQIPKLGFGLMRLPILGGNGEIDIEKCKEMVDYYMDNGLNYFDTAYMYHEGKSENAVKAAIVDRYPRESFTLADKLPIWSAKEASDVEKIFNDQLQKCGVTYFDFYLLHAMSDEREQAHLKFGSYDFCSRMKAEGKIKHFGFSFHGTVEDLRNILAAHPELEFVQLQLNYFDWEENHGKEFYDIAREFGKPIIVMEPVRGGALAKLPSEVEKIFKDADKNASPASWAIRYIASMEGIMTVLSGMSTMAQVEDNVSYMKDFKPLNESEAKTVDTAAKVLREIPNVPCTACKYCYKCPKNIPIHEIFGIYNDYLRSKDFGKLRGEYAKFDRKTNASACIQCGLCSSVCPQVITIPERLAEINQLMN